MILRLRNGLITIKDNGLPTSTKEVHITYDYELGTNHYTTVLYINNRIHKGNVIDIDLDIDGDTLDLKVELLDAHKHVLKEYKGSFSYLKLCLIGTDKIPDMYKKLKELYNENKKLKEKGEVI